MGTQPHPFDASAGEATHLAQEVILPDDAELLKNDNVRLGDEQIVDLIAYYIYRYFTLGDNTAPYIIGNGEPPVGGYTPTTRAIQILGSLGVKLNCPVEINGRLKRSGSGATFIDRETDISVFSTTANIGITADTWVVRNPAWLGDAATYTIVNTDAEETNRVDLWVQDMVAGQTLTVVRTGPGTILTVDGPGTCQFTFRRHNSLWRLYNHYAIEGAVVTLVNP